MTKKEAGFFHRLEKKVKYSVAKKNLKKNNNQNSKTLHLTIFAQVKTRAMGEWIHGKF